MHGCHTCVTPIRFLSDKATGDTVVCHLYFLKIMMMMMLMMMVMMMMMMDDTKGMGVTHVWHMVTHMDDTTTPGHHRDEELPMPSVRICRTVCTDQQLVNSSNIENLRIYTTVDTNPPRVSESTELLIQIGRGS